MRPYYEHAGITIYHGDCLGILRELPRVAIVTDPPYGTGWVRGGGGVGIFHARHEKSEWDTFSLDWLNLCPADSFAVFAPLSKQSAVANAIAADAILYYRKTNPRPNGPTREAIIVRPTPWKMDDWEYEIYNGDTKAHPCQKPLELLEWLIRGTVKPNALVCDPFMGSGTTLIAAKKVGHHAIGIEIEEKYCEIAAKRLSQEVFQFGGGCD